MIGACAVIGDLNVDLTFTGINGFPKLGREIIAKEYSLDMGGSGGVVSSILSELGIRTYIISTIGDDYYGRFLKKELELSGVKTNKILVENKSTGLTVNLSYDKDKSQVSSVNLLEQFKIDENLLESIENLKHVYFCGYYKMKGLQKDYLRIINSIKKKYNDVTFSLDTNDDPTDKWGEEIFDILENIDIFFANKNEALKITKKPNLNSAIDLLSKYVKKVIIKLGIQGYLAKINSETYRGYCKNQQNINFKDSTGAGDNFDAAFIYGLLNSWPVNKTLDFANFCAEKSIEYVGGVGTKEKFEQIIQENKLKKE